MNTPLHAKVIEIENFDEYLSIFLPKNNQNNSDEQLTPEAIGIKMAEETLTQIQILLLKDKV